MEINSKGCSIQLGQVELIDMGSVRDSAFIVATWEIRKRSNNLVGWLNDGPKGGSQ